MYLQFSSVQPLSHVRLFATPWLAARQVSLSITNSRSSLRLTSIESVIPSSHLILCRPFSSCPQSLPASESFPMSQLLAWGGQSLKTPGGMPPSSMEEPFISLTTGAFYLHLKPASPRFCSNIYQSTVSPAFGNSSHPGCYCCLNIKPLGLMKSHRIQQSLPDWY